MEIGDRIREQKDKFTSMIRVSFAGNSRKTAGFKKGKDEGI